MPNKQIAKLDSSTDAFVATNRAFEEVVWVYLEPLLRLIDPPVEDIRRENELSESRVNHEKEEYCGSLKEEMKL